LSQLSQHPKPAVDKASGYDVARHPEHPAVGIDEATAPAIEELQPAIFGMKAEKCFLTSSLFGAEEFLDYPTLVAQQVNEASAAGCGRLNQAPSASTRPERLHEPMGLD
jgi:hypothetical protein